jgi:RNA polymerase sigma-70 factor (ECF subfamily)
MQAALPAPVFYFWRAHFHREVRLLPQEAPMCREANARDQEIGCHRPYLRLLVGMYLDRRVWPQIDPSDVVQETLLQAFKKLEQCGPNLLAWLRGILTHRLLTAIRKEKQRARERQMLDALDKSSCRINAGSAAEHSSPSQQAMKHELLERLAETLNQLPECEAEVIILIYLQDRSQADAAMHLGRSRPAVAGLLHRGLKRLRKLLQERE